MERPASEGARPGSTRSRREAEDATAADGESKEVKAGASVRLLERAIDLLECIERNRAPMGVRALETETGVPKATAQRLLDAFERRGYVQKSRGRYSLAPGTVRLARSYLAGDSLITIAGPVLQGLTALTGETCALYVRQGFDRIMIQTVDSPHPLRHTTPVGERVPLHLGASGQVLCGGMTPEMLDQYLDTVAPARLASGKLLSKDDLRERIEFARYRGYAMATDDRFAGISAVAAPVFNNAGQVAAAINIAGPTSRVADKLEQFSIEVRNAARDIGEKLSKL